MPETYAADRIDQTTFHASVSRYTEDDTIPGKAIEVATEDVARAWVEGLLRLGTATAGDIRKGTYERYEFDDGRFGHVIDAEWRQDEDWYRYGWLDGHGRMRWDEEGAD